MMKKTLLMYLLFLLVYGCDNSFGKDLTKKQGCSTESFAQQVIESARCITYYPGEVSWSNFDRDRFGTALEAMQGVGANTVWLVLPWMDFQPVALPEPVWNEKSIVNLNIAVGLAKERGMNVILPLCYLGVGWSPQGIDSRIWTADENMYNAFKSYTKTLITKLLQNGHGNMIFLLFGEGCYPVHTHLREYDVTITSFKEWCHNSNKDIGYWNNRWNTSYTWDNLLPFVGKVKEGKNSKNLWTDYWKWSIGIVRSRHGGLAREIRGLIENKALIGYHDDLMITKDWAGDASPIPTDNPYQFLSFAHYYVQSVFESLDKFISRTNTFISKSKSLYPDMPLGIFETGLCEKENDRNDQAKVVGAMANITKSRGIGINLWMWQDHTTGDKCQQTFGLLTLEGKKKPAFFALSKVWQKSDIRSDR